MKVSPMAVTLVDSMGTDLSVVNAARVSFDKESGWIWDEQYCEYKEGELKEADVKLIRYLAKHNHFTPFTHCTATFRIKVPIFIARQIHKHQVGFTVNEVSRRYVDSEPEFYLPDYWRKKAENVKQGSSNTEVDVNLLADSCAQPSALMLESLRTYNAMIDLGVCAEQCRMMLPQGVFTEFWMTGSLYGWARLVKLRTGLHAQVEIQSVAQMIDKFMSELFPVSWKELLSV